MRKNSILISGDHGRAARIARELVKPLSIGDIESVITESLDCAEFERLQSAIDPEEYAALNKRQDECEAKLKALGDEDARKLCGEYYETMMQLSFFRELSHFHLGFQAALRLLGVPPDMHVVEGGARKAVAS